MKHELYIEPKKANIMVICFLYIIRPIISTIIKLFYYIYYSIKLKNNSELYKKYKKNLESYNNIKSLNELINWFKYTYKYKHDGLFGLLDHDTSKKEFFTVFSDCDDMALWSKRKLKKLGYKAQRVFMANYKFCPNSWHFDCYFQKDGKHYFFNYGYICEGNSFKEALQCVQKSFHGETGHIYVKLL